MREDVLCVPQIDGKNLYIKVQNINIVLQQVYNGAKGYK